MTKLKKTIKQQKQRNKKQSETIILKKYTNK